MSNRRPFGVIAIAILQAVNAILTFLPLVLGEQEIFRFSMHAEGFEVASAVLGVFGLFAAVGLVLLRRWGWTAAMLWADANLAADLVAYASGDPRYPAMAVSVVAVFYLNQRDVQAAFGQANVAPERLQLDRP